MELLGGFWTNSLALLSDSAHVFMDLFALGLSWFALYISSQLPSELTHAHMAGTDQKSLHHLLMEFLSLLLRVLSSTKPYERTLSLPLM